MSEPKTEGLSNVELTQPTLDEFAVTATKKPKSVRAVQFTQEVLAGKDVKNARRTEGDIEFNIGHAVYFPAKGQEVRIKCNDWLIIDENGRKYVIPEGQFNEEWDVVHTAKIESEIVKIIVDDKLSITKKTAAEIIAKAKLKAAGK